MQHNVRVLDAAQLISLQAARRQRLAKEELRRERVDRFKASASRHSATIALSCLLFILTSGITLLIVGCLHGWW